MPYYFTREKRFSYEIVTPPTVLALTTDELKEQLKITISDTLQDCYLETIIKAVSDYFEKYTNRILIDTKYKTYRDSFSDCMELKRSALVSLDTFKYLKDDVLTTVDAALYYTTSDSFYGSIYLKDGESWPSDIDFRYQAIAIEFTAGFGATESTIPKDIKMALLQHATALYMNRGDCANASQNNLIPTSAKAVYDLYKIVSLC